VLTNGSAEGVAKPALTAGGAIQLLKGPLLDINMAQVGQGLHGSAKTTGGCLVDSQRVKCRLRSRSGELGSRRRKRARKQVAMAF
jgi:hypothetical protein